MSVAMTADAAYAELQLTTNFTFLEGASHPEELVATARRLGHAALAITDRNTLAGVVRAHSAAREAGLRLIVGARLDFADGTPSLLCLPRDRAAYGQLAHLLSQGKRRAAKGACHLGLADMLDHAAGQILIAVAPATPDASFAEALGRLKGHLNESLPRDLYLAASPAYNGEDAARLAALAGLAGRLGTPLVATNDVIAHAPERRALADVLACVREGVKVENAGFLLARNAERHLKPPAEMARLFRHHPDAIARTLAIAGRCRFSLDELRYEYPAEPVPAGCTPQQELVRLTWLGAADRFPAGIPLKVRRLVEHELALIETLGYAPYFLTVHDIVRFARARDILCQGRGSAANSATCYCLGITAVDPSRMEVLFERFISAERNEPPDIDVDFEHERREEVIQYVYAKYGRRRAGMTGVTITYRTKSALRDVGKALGLGEDAIVALQKAAWRRALGDVTGDDLREAGLDPAAWPVRRTLSLADELIGFPRHLSQHTGGMVLTQGPLDRLVPIENAAMEDRTVIEWNKDDLDELGILKIDILGLGMLTCVRKAFGLIGRHHGRALDLASVPAEDPAVYDMLCKADSLGVFQVESRAQMSMLPRLKPRTFFDLVIEVAIVRPGPIQGDMVHPYLRRRAGLETVDYVSDEMRGVLERTLGVPLFQEQAMRIAIVAAGFTPAEADQLRRAMATFRRFGTIHYFRDKFITGMRARGYQAEFAERCFKQIEGFADYGFPESHAASFALLVYVSAWLKCHYPAAFGCALLNSQPMGFYAPAQIVRDMRNHGVIVRPVDGLTSAWDGTLEADPASAGGMAVRLGLRQAKGLNERDANLLAAARNAHPGLAGAGREGLHRLARAGAPRAALDALARADAWREGLGLNRREALWTVRALSPGTLPLFAAAQVNDIGTEPPLALPRAAPAEDVADDYRALHLSLKSHPVSFLRERLAARGFTVCRALGSADGGDLPAGGVADGARIAVAGVVVTRQRPGSAQGVVFATLEDESGIANIIIWPAVFERFRAAVLSSSLMGVDGQVQRADGVVHVVARRIFDLSPLLARLSADAPHPDARLPMHSRDFQ